MKTSWREVRRAGVQERRHAAKKTAIAVRALSPDFTTWDYLTGIVGKLPASFVKPVTDRYRKEYRENGQYAANVWIGGAGQTVTVTGAKLASSDVEIAAEAKRHADTVQGLMTDHVNAIGHRLGVTSDSLGDVLAGYCTEQGVKAPEGVELRGLVARLTDAAWWRRQLRRTVVRKVEGFARGMGMVQRRKALYASDETVARHAEQKRRNLAALENTEAVKAVLGPDGRPLLDKDGRPKEEVFNLAELAALGVSNPSVRFAELMVRVRGMEAWAKEAGDIGLFVTGTAPSQMHAVHAETGQQNRLFDGTAPKDCQQWLARQWSRCRTALARLGISYYGVRVAEPHHDGTPHWHMLVFIKPQLSPGRSAVARLMAVFRRYLLRGDWVPLKVKDIAANVRQSRQTIKAANYWGGVIQSQQKIDQRAKEKADTARRRRVCDFKVIDWARGSAAGYLVKYLAKNISGQRMGLDLESNTPGTETAGRVLAWASCWGIRQFQVIGGPPVGCWRELRKIKEKPEQLELFEAWAATGSKQEERKPDWGRYIAAQGGMSIKRAERPVQLWKLAEPGRLTKYLDEAPARVAGVECAGVVTRSRETVWTIRRAANVGSSALDRQLAERRIQQDQRPVYDGRGSVVVRRAPGVGGGREARPGLAFDLAPKAPWTRVNNCTQRTAPKENGLAQNMAHIAKLPARVPENWFVGPIPPGRVFCLDIFDQLRELKHAGEA